MRLGKTNRWWAMVGVVAVMGAALGYAFGMLLSVAEEIKRPHAFPEETPQASRLRVIVLTPALTEIVFAVGGGACVVGRGSHVTHPPEALAIPSVGGIIDPRLEVIRALRPHLVLTQGEVGGLRALCAEMGARLEVVSLETLDDLHRVIREVGAMLGAQDEARALSDSIRSSLDRIARRARKTRRVPVFICVGRQFGSPARLWTVGPGSFLHEIVDLAGGENVFADLPRRYQEVSAEGVIRRAPQCVLEFVPDRGLPDPSSAWELLLGSGVRVRVIRGDHVLYLGPRVPLTAQQVAEALEAP